MTFYSIIHVVRALLRSNFYIGIRKTTNGRRDSRLSLADRHYRAFGILTTEFFQIEETELIPYKEDIRKRARTFLHVYSLWMRHIALLLLLLYRAAFS